MTVEGRSQWQEVTLLTEDKMFSAVHPSPVSFIKGFVFSKENDFLSSSVILLIIVNMCELWTAVCFNWI